VSVPPAADRAQSALRFQRAFLLLLVTAISIIFLMVIRGFLVAVLLAAIFAGMSYPLYLWLRKKFGGRAGLASIVTILILVLCIGVPLAGLLTLVTTQAIQLSQGAGEWLEMQSGRLDQLREMLNRIPLIARLVPEQIELKGYVNEIASRAGPVLMGTLAAVSRSTLAFTLQLFVCLYAMFFFFVDGPRILRMILYYVPLDASAEEQLLERFVSVTRATLKGSLLIGFIQGGLAGIAFAVAGVPGAAFWGTVMVVLSVLPAVGTALIWIPAVIYLILSGATGPAIGLGLWCALVVGSVDNFLRPQLIGRDARMSDLLILLSTLGGIALFGALGFIIGPIVAALFVTVWHIYGETFKTWLPEVPPAFL
jgi:predicted PurR-regulated permease PerM